MIRIRTQDCGTDFYYNYTVRATTADKARAKLQRRSPNLHIFEVEQIHDIVSYHVVGVEKTTGITLSNFITSDEQCEKTRLKDAKWIGQSFKTDNPQLYKKGQRANFVVQRMIAQREGIVTVADQLANIREVI